MDQTHLDQMSRADADAPDPEGGERHGVSGGYDFTGGALGHPELIYTARGRDVLLQADVYDDHVHLHCPCCRLDGHEHGLMIRKGQKDFEFEPMRQVQFPGWEEIRMMALYPKGSGGTLRTVPFTCPWCTTKMYIRDNVVVLA